MCVAQLVALAYLSDEKGVQRRMQMDRLTGKVELCKEHLLLIETAKERVAFNAGDLHATVLLLFETLPNEDRSVTLRTRLSLLSGALASLDDSPYPWARRVRPRLLSLKGSFSAFAGDFKTAKRAFKEAVTMLRQDSTTSMWPVDPYGIAGEGTSIRKVMIASVEVDIGRAALYQHPPDHDLAQKCLQQFIDTVPPDTHYFPQAHFELASSLFESHRGTHRQPTKRAMASTVARAKKLVELAETKTIDVPILRPVDGNECDMIDGVKGWIAMYEVSSLAKEKRAAPSSPTPASKRLDACWMCGITDLSVKLKSCSRCGMAQYCSAECQRLHWPVHKKSCKKM